jgi:hypothetical protein
MTASSIMVSCMLATYIFSCKICVEAVTAEASHILVPEEQGCNELKNKIIAASNTFTEVLFKELRIFLYFKVLFVQCLSHGD